MLQKIYILFVFYKNIYNQIDGVAIGYPLATNFIGFYESRILNEYTLNKIIFYLRYVDGILAAFEKNQDSLNF